MTARTPGLAVSQAQKAQRRRENIAGYLFMAPSLLFFLGFVIFPMGMCLVTSFFNYTMTDFSWIGLANYVEMFQDAIFGKALVNTIVIVVVSVPVTFLLIYQKTDVCQYLFERAKSSKLMQRIKRTRS